jgi:hypothetical protein
MSFADFDPNERRDAYAQRVANAAPLLLAALRAIVERPGPLFHSITEEDEKHWPQIAQAKALLAELQA